MQWSSVNQTVWAVSELCFVCVCVCVCERESVFCMCVCCSLLWCFCSAKLTLTAHANVQVLLHTHTHTHTKKIKPFVWENVPRCFGLPQMVSFVLCNVILMKDQKTTQEMILNPQQLENRGKTFQLPPILFFPCSLHKKPFSSHFR